MASCYGLRTWSLFCFGCFCGIVNVLGVVPQRRPSLTARSYNTFGSANAINSEPNGGAGFRNSVNTNPYLNYPTSTNDMNFRLPGPPQPPNPPPLGGGGGTGSNVNPWLFGWGGFNSGGGGQQQPTNMGGFNNNYNGANNNNYQQSGVGNQYGSNGNGQMFGNAGFNVPNYAGGANMNNVGYRPQNQGSPANGQQNQPSSNNGYNGFFQNPNQNQGGNSYNNPQNSNSGFTLAPQFAGTQPVPSSSGSAYTARKNCKVDSLPGANGYCALRNQLKKKCKNLTSSYSVDCSGKEVCCYNPNEVIITTTSTTSTTTTPSTTTTTTTTTPTAVTSTLPQIAVTAIGRVEEPDRASQMTTDVLQERADRYCMPNDNTQVFDGICISNQIVNSSCRGVLKSPSTNCYADESCCYVAPVAMPSYTINPATITLSTTQTPATTTVTAAVTTATPAVTTVTPAVTTVTPVATTVVTTAGPTTSITVVPGGTVAPNSGNVVVSQGCSPGSYPSINNGVCTASSQIAKSCKGQQISPSIDCNRNEYCCFVADTANGGFQLPPGVCRPATQPSVVNGSCVDKGQISAQCGGQMVATSGNCQNNELCCFWRSAIVTTTTAKTVPTTITTTTTTTSPATTTTITSAATTKTTAATTPTTSTQTQTQPTNTPVTTSSVTSVATSQSTTAVTTAPLTTTSVTVLPSSTGQTQVTQGTSGAVCRPGSYPNLLPNGTCVARGQLSQQCKGIQIDYSLDCGYYEYCCYQHGSSPVGRPEPNTVAPNSCTPESYPTISNGFCVNADQLVTQCSGDNVEASTALSCGVSRYCCFSHVSSGVTTASSGQVTQGSTVAYSSVANTTPTATISSGGSTTAPTSSVTTATAVTAVTSSGGSSVTSSGRNCRPQTYPNTNTNGVCMLTSALSQQCSGSQASPSLDCNTGETCCYSNPPVTPAPATGNGQCSPVSNPAFRGICVGASQISQTCAGMEMSTSRDCAVDGFCCYAVDGPTVTIATGTPSTSTVAVSAVPTTSSTGVSTVLTTTPVVTATGLTVSTGSTLSSAVTTSSTGGPGSTTTPATGGNGCSPQGYPAIKNGACTSLFNLASQCLGIQAAPSLDCGPYQYCCFTVPAVNPNPPEIPAGQCSPVNIPTVKNGICIDHSQINTYCAGSEISESKNCDVNQYCCYYTEGGSFTTPSTIATVTSSVSQGVSSTPTTSITGSTTYATTSNTPVITSVTTTTPSTTTTTSATTTTTTPTTTTTTRTTVTPVTTTKTTGALVSYSQTDGGSGSIGSSAPCSPKTAPDVNNGVCVDTSQLVTQCRAARISRSAQCALNQYCCFGGVVSGGSTGSHGSGSTSGSNSGGNSGSGTGGAGSGSGSGSTSGNNSGSGTGGTGSGSGSGSGGGASCSPTTAPSVTNGVCIQLEQLSTQCKAVRISKSPDCHQEREFCCFSSNIMATTTSNPIGGNACTPSTQTDVKNGVCVATSQLSAQCKAQRISKSGNCQTGQFCCFSSVTSSGTSSGAGTGSGSSTGSGSGGGSGTGSGSSSGSNSGSGAGYSQSSSGSNKETQLLDSDLSGGCQPGCTPNTQPTITNGKCTDVGQLSTQCKGNGRAFSKSNGCASSQFCCFNTADIGGSSSSQGCVPKACTPKTQPTITNGKCISTNQLSQQCKGQTFSKSNDCQTSQFCCFNPSSRGAIQLTQLPEGSQAPETVSCTPVSDSTVNDGKCVSGDQLTNQCRGMRLSKSGDCNSKHFCCFNAKVVTTSVKQSTGGGSSSGCTPNSDSSVTNGMCVPESQLTNMCNAKQFSKSPNCQTNEFCCFNRNLQTSSGAGSGSGSSTGSGSDEGSGTGSGSSSGSGTSSQTQGSACTPNTEPTINNGICMDKNQLSSQCNTPQRFSKSNNCQGSQFCCFSQSQGPTNKGPIPQQSEPVTTCVPSTSQGSNGICVNVKEVSKKCQGQRLSKSISCTTSQFCCFTGEEETKIAVPNAENQQLHLCSPTTSPGLSGFCLERTKITAQCQGRRLSRSADCSSSQFCCFSDGSSGASPNTAVKANTGGSAINAFTKPNTENSMFTNIELTTKFIPTGSGNCSPITDSSITTGHCIEQGHFCQGSQLARSSMCSSTQLCCFTTTVPANSVMQPNPGNTGSSSVITGVAIKLIPATSGACTPLADPSITNGQCIEAGRFCQGNQISRSNTCSPTELCCFNSSAAPIGPSPSLTFGPSGFGIDSASSCSPMTAPDVKNGICVNQNQLEDRCRGQKLAKSNGCSPSQFCCFNDEPIDNANGFKVSASKNCRPNSKPDINTGICIDAGQLTSQCQVPQRLSKSADCLPAQFCCFDDTETRQSSGSLAISSCTPVSDPSVNDGICLNEDQLAKRQCEGQGQRLSKSSNCASNQFCCFKGPTDDPTSGNQQGAPSCTPNTEPQVSDGVCLNQDQLQSQCKGQRMSKSVDCTTSQFCCFGDEPVNKVGAVQSSGCTPNTNTDINNGVCVSQNDLKTQCQGQKLSKSNNCAPSQFCCFTDPNQAGQGAAPFKVVSGNKQATGQCTPNTESNVNDGVCLNKDQLQGQCQGTEQRFSKSVNCTKPQYCCFSAPTSNKVGTAQQGGGLCMPNTNTDIDNGICVNVNDLKTQCQGQKLSKSNNCAPSQFCCFSDSDQSTDASGNVKSGNKQASGQCTPNTEPNVSDGVCVNQDQLKDQCQGNGQRFSKSANCAEAQYCCFAGQSTNKVGTAQQGGGSCMPNTNTDINDGVCLNVNELKTQCQGQKLAKSNNCGPSQFCCFADSNQAGQAIGASGNVISGNKQASGQCTPNTEPNVSDGVCLNTDQLKSQCQGQGQRFSKSANCSTAQYCCFADQPTNKVGTVQQGGGSCMPNTNTDINDGVCVNVNDLKALCQGQRFTKSSNCSPSQFCCFFDSDQVVQGVGPSGNEVSGNKQIASGQCTPKTDPTVNNGACVSKDQLTAQCEGQRFSKSGGCPVEQFCCFGAQTGSSGSNNQQGSSSGSSGSGSQQGGSSCTPNTDPSVSNGACVSKDQLTAQCEGQRFSKSGGCPVDQFCCFGAQTGNQQGSSSGSSGLGSQQGGGSCTPNTEPDIKNGVCVNQDELKAQCQGQRLSKSGNCTTSQFCCFSAQSGNKMSAVQPGDGGSSCTPNTNPAINNGVCVNSGDLKTQCQGQKLSKSTNCAASQFCCFSDSDQAGINNAMNQLEGSASGNKQASGRCTPLTDPSVNNGVCITEDQLQNQCQGQGQRLSKSNNCASNQFCCFGDSTGSASSGNKQAVSSANSDYGNQQGGGSYIPGSGSGTGSDTGTGTGTTTGPIQSGCSPISDTTVSNGNCVEESQIQAQCITQRFSRSRNCSASQYCCFTGGSSPLVNPGPGCTPSTDPTVSNGLCVQSDQLSAQCSSMEVAHSLNCGQDQLCCFKPSSNQGIQGGGGAGNQQGGSSGGSNSGNQQGGGSTGGTSSGNQQQCTPNTEPQINNGVCVNQDQLKAQCQNLRLSKSSNCASSQFCCFAAVSGSAGSGNQQGSGSGNQQGGSSTGGTSSGNQQQCTPTTEPQINNGVCVNQDQLIAQCQNLRASKSGNCSASQFCCFGAFSGSTSSGNQQGGGSTSGTGSGNQQQCTPTTEPQINNGVCVNQDQLIAQCQNLRASKSGNCSASQFCCFGAFSGSTSSGNQQGGGSTSGTGSGNQQQCTPTTEPQINNGVCVNQDQLIAQCQNLRASKSGNCSASQFCCFGAFSGSTSSGNQQGSGSTSGTGSGNQQQCTPTTEPQINNGVCVNQNQLKDQCQNLRLSKSLNCSSGQFCCFSGTSSGNQQGGGSSTGAGSANYNSSSSGSSGSSGSTNNNSGCSPISDQSVSNGQCFEQDQINNQCVGQRFSRSRACSASQFCCFNGGSVGPIATGPGCTPATDPSVSNGLCVPNDQLSAQCSGMEVSRSLGCGQDQLCCFTPAKKTYPSGSGFCTPTTEPQINNGVCVNQDKITAQCQGQRLSKSGDCASGQFCCFPQPATVCTPSTAPSVNNGACTDRSQLTSQCQGQRFSKSSNCSGSQFCCFNFGNANKISTSGGCVPFSDSTVNNGVCLDVPSLSTSCKNQLISKSSDCLDSQYCCFNSSNLSSSTALCSPKTSPSVTNGRCVDEPKLTTTCRVLRFSKSDNCTTSQFCCFDLPNTKSPLNKCTPETEKNITNGQCMISSDLPALCVGNARAAKSGNCTPSQWCCFAGPTGTIAMTVISGPGTAQSISDSTSNNTGIKGISLLGGDGGVPIQVSSGGSTSVTLSGPTQLCTPNSDPTINNGLCMKIRELQVSCVDKKASPSPDCPRFNWCCYDESGKPISTQGIPVATTEEPIGLVNPIRLDVLLGNRCTPVTNSDVHDGSCVDPSQIRMRCKGQQFSKSTNCETGQMCCFSTSSLNTNDVKTKNVSTVSSGNVQLPVDSSISCTPNVDSTVHNGQCMRMRELSEKCVDRKASPSLDCNLGQWCCYGDSQAVLTSETGQQITTLATATTTTTSTETPVPGSCAPNSQPSLRNGMCQTIRQLQVDCVEKQAAPSEDCDMGHWCCYTDPAMKKIAEEAAATTPEVFEFSSTEPPPLGSACTPNADSNVSNGICLPTKDLRTKCRNQRVSKSPQCRLGHWCCFAALQSNSTTDDFLPRGRSYMGAL